MGFVVRAVLAIGAIYALSPVNTGETPDVAALARSAVPSLAEAVPAATGSLGRDAAAAALAACAARPQACADMAATLRGSGGARPAATLSPGSSPAPTPSPAPSASRQPPPR